MRRATTAAFLLGLSPCLAIHAGTDESPIPQTSVPMPMDSGWVRAPGNARGVAYAAVVRVPGRTWVRLVFQSAALGRTPLGGQTTHVRITSLLDGGTQIMNARALEQWDNTSAYFNGDAVLVEIVADPAAEPSRLVLSHAMCGAQFVPGEGGVADICLGTDDRVLSAEAPNGRLMPFGCTAWIFDDPNHTLLTAGHCNPGASDVVQFNVPLSDGGGVVSNPPPEHQYAVDASSVQRLSGGIGDDWCYFGCFDNSTTGLTPYEAQGACYALAPAPSVDAPPQSIRITGFGTVEPPVLLTWNQVQKTHAGPYTALAGTALSYQTDTSGGNSGSPVFDMASGMAIGIHTHGGCAGSGGANQGTASQHIGLQNALANPKGVCVPVAQLDFEFPDGLPSQLNPAGDSIRVHVEAGAGGEPQPGTGTLHLDVGSGFASVAMAEVAPNVYDAVFPAIACGSDVSFYFSATCADGSEARAPVLAPVVVFEAPSTEDIHVHLHDSFDLDQGWTTSHAVGVTTGFWQRVAPTATGLRVPPADADASGQCYVTDNAQGADIDGGSVSLMSPSFQITEPGAVLRYWRWFSTSSITLEDTLAVHLSIDGGSSWLPIETVSSNGVGWYRQEFALQAVEGFAPSATCKLRFVASDVGPLSSVEAGIDGVEVRTVMCPAACPADLDSDGTVSGSDLGMLLAAWGQGAASGADLTNNGIVDGADLGALLAAWGACGDAR